MSNNLGMEDAASKVIYQKSTQQIGKASRFLHVALLKITVHCMMWPIVIISFAKYFATDLGENAFELPLFGW